MNIKDIKNILESNAKIISQLNLNHKRPSIIKRNRMLLKNICEQNNFSIKELLYIIQNMSNLENLHVFCKICGNKNTFISHTIGYQQYCSLKCAYKSEERNIKCVNTKRNDIDEDGNNAYQRAVLKCKNNLDTDGKTCYQRGIKKTIQAKLNNIDENGLNSFQRARQKQIEKQKADIDENGLNGLQRVGRKANKTRLLDIDENGLNGHQRSVIKGKHTNFIKYDNENWNNIEQINRTKRNNIDKDGLNSFQRAAIHAKETFNKKFGVNNGSQIHITNFKDINKEFFIYNFVKHGLFDSKSCAAYFNINIACVNHYKKKFNINVPNSHTKQRELLNIIKLFYNKEIKYNCRTIIKPKELDIYIPEKKLAIEFNGIYWHSMNKGCNINYHQQKSIMCLEKGIKLIHIYDNEWNNKITRKIILAELKRNLCNDIQYKNYIIENINYLTYRNFCIKNNFNISKKYNICLGVFINNKLVQVFTLMSRTNTYKIINNYIDSDYNTDFTTTLLDYTINNYNPKIILCNIDFNKDDGNIYKNYGFICRKISKPNKFYIDINTGLILNNIEEDINFYNNLNNFKILKLYGSGTLKLMLNVSSTTI